ncbi:porin [Achromobacter anxifer]
MADHNKSRETLVHLDVAIRQWGLLPRSGSATQQECVGCGLPTLDPAASEPLLVAVVGLIVSRAVSLAALAMAFVAVINRCAIGVGMGSIRPRRLLFPLHLCGISVLSCAPWADSRAATVQLYGVVDTFMMYGRNGGAASARMGSGGASDSFWGIRAVEDLGNGVRVSFRLEGDIDTKNGNQLHPTSTYNRDANIAISSESWGTLKLGRQFPAALPVSADPFFFVQRFSAVAISPQIVRDLGVGIAPLPQRIGDAISYQTPSMDGMVIHAVYAPRYAGNVATGEIKRDSDKFVNGYAGVQATYSRGPWTVGGSYSAMRPAYALGPNKVPLELFRTDAIAVSVAHTTGALQTSIGYGRISSNAPGTYGAQMMSVGSLLLQGPHIFRASLLYRTINGRADRAFGGVLGYDYQMSKRVSVYTRMAGFWNSSGSAFGILANLPREMGATTTTVAFGIAQRF